jgi:hypothetical protein
MIPYDSSSEIDMTTRHESAPLEQIETDVTPPIGITPPQVLAQDVWVEGERAHNVRVPTRSRLWPEL